MAAWHDELGTRGGIDVKSSTLADREMQVRGAGSRAQGAGSTSNASPSTCGQADVCAPCMVAGNEDC